MTNKPNRKNHQKYSAMTTEALEELLRQDAQNPEETDAGQVLCIMEILADRNESGETKKTPRQAWESFQDNYLDAGEDASEAEIQRKPDRHPTGWVRRMIATAALLIVAVGIPVTVKAIGWENICGAIAKWTVNDIFYFTHTTEETDDTLPDDCFLITDAESAPQLKPFDRSILPVWIPDGYILGETKKVDMVGMENYHELYTKGVKALQIDAQTYNPSEPIMMELEEFLEIYEKSGTQYYIFRNRRWIVATWLSEGFQCSICGEISMEELKKMIDSIERTS